MRIVVLAGGTSTERAISIVSGTGICTALREKGHQAILVDVFGGTENVDWENPFPKEYDVEAASAYIKSFDDKIEDMKKERKSFFGPNVIKLCELCDIVFLGLHGANGEDGKVQAAFDLMGIKYTGTGYLSSALAMHSLCFCPPDTLVPPWSRNVSYWSGNCLMNSSACDSLHAWMISSSDALGLPHFRLSRMVPVNRTFF